MNRPLQATAECFRLTVQFAWKTGNYARSTGFAYQLENPLRLVGKGLGAGGQLLPLPTNLPSVTVWR
jgi:hypothetical protein